MIGVGSTTTALNLAHSMKTSSSSVCLIDLDYKYRSVALMTNKSHIDYIDDIDGHYEPIHDAIDYLFVNPTDASVYSEILEEMQNRYDYVITDLPAYIEDVTDILRLQDRIMVVTSLDMPALETTNNYIARLATITDVPHVSIVVNKSLKNVDMPVNKIKKTIDGSTRLASDFRFDYLPFVDPVLSCSSVNQHHVENMLIDSKYAKMMSTITEDL